MGKKLLLSIADAGKGLAMQGVAVAVVLVVVEDGVVIEEVLVPIGGADLVECLGCCG